MSIHKKVMKLYERYYDSDVAVGVDKYFLEEVSDLIYSIEATLGKFIHGSNKVE